MGIFDALNTSVGGLQAQSFALQNISGNIANASTTGYKGIGTTFEDLIPDATSPSRQVAGGVTAFAQPTITSQGTVSTTTVATNMAINGDGFFSVQKSTGTVDNVPVFSGVTDYTRRGDFQTNANGNLVNGAGYYLMGVAVDPKTGNPLGNIPQVLQFQNNFIPAQNTTSISYAANLPSTPTTVASPNAASGTITALGGLNPLDFIQNPTLTAASGFTDATTTGAVKTAAGGSNIDSNTTLNGVGGGDTLTSGFTAGPPADTITVDGQTLTFVASGASGPNQINVTDNISTLLAKIDALSGAATPSSVSGGAITLHTGTKNDLSVTSSNAGAMAALGFAALPVTKARTVVNSPATGVVIANDQQTFLNESISGGAVTAFDQTGTAVNLQLRWAKTDSATLGGTHTNTWNLFYQTNPSASGTQTAWVNAGTNYTFSAAGALTSPATPAITIPNVTVGNQSLGNLSFSTGTGGLTQFASTGGTATINAVTQNGFAAGQLQSVAINNNGIVVGTFSNGQNLDLASVTLSHFNGTNYLKALDGGAYAVTVQSGPAIIGASGNISGSSLEGSNTDIASEFTKLIVTQQAYSANTKVITTANTMVQDLLNVLR
ncbi:flagellar hook protein FlgE [Bradyrhizobium lablabi]|uniref:Flagellar hook protein FlgE n=1 Tax=Bradyrhizobium lablabi TaxID=722472 RepID=A0A1M7BMW6_9BRAD|nr:flagellar hook-basal body complex protein [Bradyrhizobium lablabi]SHL56378.1 flagellar hook protein FlgE [Bradyrhizobium lablabi]